MDDSRNRETTVKIRAVLYLHLGDGHDIPSLTVNSSSDYLRLESKHISLLASLAPCQYPMHILSHISNHSQIFFHSPRSIFEHLSWERK